MGRTPKQRKRQNMTELVRCIAAGAGVRMEIKDEEMKPLKKGKRKYNKHDRLHDFMSASNQEEEIDMRGVMRLISFEGIPYSVFSAKGSGPTKRHAEEAAAHALLNMMKTLVPDQLVYELFNMTEFDSNCPQIQAMRPLFDTFLRLVRERDLNGPPIDMLSCSGYEVQVGNQIRSQVRNILRPKNAYKKPPVGGNSLEVNGGRFEALKKNGNEEEDDDVIVLDPPIPKKALQLIDKMYDFEESSDEEELSTDTIFVGSSKGENPMESIPQPSSSQLEIRKRDLERKAKTERQLCWDRSNQMRYQMESSLKSPGYDLPKPVENPIVDFGPIQTSGKGPAPVKSAVGGSERNAGGQYYTCSTDDDEEEEDEPEIKKRRMNEDDDVKICLNLTTSEEFVTLSSSSGSSSSIDAPSTPPQTSLSKKGGPEEEELEMVDEWEEDNKTIEGEENDEEEGEDEYLEEKEEETISADSRDEKSSVEDELELDETQESMEIDHHEMYEKKSGGFRAEMLYEGESSYQEFVDAKKWPKDYEKSLIGVITNEKVAAQIETAVHKITENASEYVERLSKDGWHHYDVNYQNSEVYFEKMKFRGLMEQALKRVLSEKMISLHVTGSSINGCGAFNSDIDMCLCFPTKSFKGEFFEDFDCQKNVSLRVLRRVDRAIRRANPNSELSKLVHRSQVISAKVPIIKLWLKRPFDHLDIDINVNNIAGIYNSHLLHYYSQCDGRFPALSLLVKHWAINCNINDAQNGTFNSYSLILLVVHYLQCGVRPAVLPNLQYLFPEKFDRHLSVKSLHLFGELVDRLPTRPPNPASLGELIIGFFQYYASFNFRQDAISIRSGQIVKRSTLPKETTYFQIFIEEPFDAVNTARCVRGNDNLTLIRKSFHAAASAFNKRNFGIHSIGVRI